MKTELILEIVSGICLLFGCGFYLLHNKKEDDKKYAVISIILTALGIGLFIGATNTPYNPEQKGDTEEITIENEIDP